MSCHTVLGGLSLILIHYNIVTLKTISGKTFAGSPVNAWSVEPDSGVAMDGIGGYKLQPPPPIESPVTS